jgi:HD-GYP domain-containing protein (c-di-GMP phosphodiesterase class II)
MIAGSDSLVTFDFTLPYSVIALDGAELLHSGAQLDEATILRIAEKGRGTSFKSSSLLEHGSIRSDLEDFMCHAPFDFIFNGDDGIRSQLKLMEEMVIPQPVISALDELKSYDYCTYQHSLIVFALTSFMMKLMHPHHVLDKRSMMVGPTHDIGKLSVPKEILSKKTPLTRDERLALDYHTVAGYVLLSYHLGDHLHPAATVALNHHERRNGSGYPRGFNNMDSLVEMVAICDIYDALLSPRPYRSGCYDNRAALEVLTALSDNGALNSQGVKALIGRNRAGYPEAEDVEISRKQRGKQPAENYFSVLEDDTTNTDSQRSKVNR